MWDTLKKESKVAVSEKRKINKDEDAPLSVRIAIGPDGSIQDDRADVAKPKDLLTRLWAGFITDARADGVPPEEGFRIETDVAITDASSSCVSKSSDLGKSISFPLVTRTCGEAENILSTFKTNPFAVFNFNRHKIIQLPNGLPATVLSGLSGQSGQSVLSGQSGRSVGSLSSISIGRRKFRWLTN